MRTIFDHIENAKRKPHHVRKQIAFGVAAGTTALIALVWFAGSVSLGTFAIKDNTSFADATGQNAVRVAAPDSGNQNLAGAAAALEDKSAPAHIDIVDTASSTPQAEPADRTIIPF